MEIPNQNNIVKWIKTNIIFAAGILMFISGTLLFARETGLNIHLFYQIISTMTTLGASYDENTPPLSIVLAIALLAMSGAILIFGVMTSHIGLKMKEVEKNILCEIKGNPLKLKGHIIVCGYGGTGEAVVKYLLSKKQEVLVIERDPGREPELKHLKGIKYYVTGDAKNKGVLRQACIEDALGMIITLSNSSENIFVALIAKQLNEKLRIATRVEDINLKESFFERYGVDDIIPVSIGEIGSELLGMAIIRPHAASFIHEVLTTEGEHVIGGVEVNENSLLAGKTVGTIRTCIHKGISNKKLDVKNLGRCMKKSYEECQDVDYEMGIIAIKRNGKVSIPHWKTKICANDVLLVIAREELIEPIKSLGAGQG